MTFGDIVSSFATQTPGGNPLGLAFDGKYFYVADLDQSVDMMTRTGVLIKRYTTPVADPRSLVLVGNRWFQARGTTDSGSISILDREFNLIKTVSIAGAISRNFQGIAFNGKFIYATEAGLAGQRSIHRFSVGLIHIDEVNPIVASGQFLGVVVIGPRIIVADVTSAQIRMFDFKGNLIKTVASPGGNPRGLTFDGKYLYSVDLADDLVYQLSLQ